MVFLVVTLTIYEMDYNLEIKDTLAIWILRQEGSMPLIRIFFFLV